MQKKRSEHTLEGDLLSNLGPAGVLSGFSCGLRQRDSANRGSRGLIQRKERKQWRDEAGSRDRESEMCWSTTECFDRLGSLDAQGLDDRSAAWPQSGGAYSGEEIQVNEKENARTNGDIVIHVFDENRQVNRDFSCNQEVLLRHMKYFESYLSGASSYDDIDISVHCDVAIFEWLIKYMENPERVETLDINNVVSILISSDFLQMDGLVEECIKFMKQSINQVLKLPIDLACLSNQLVSRLARLFDDEELESIKDKRDKLSSKLYAYKLAQLLEDDGTLCRCIFCRALFTSELRECTVCPKAEIFIDFHGNVIAQHVPDTDWDIDSYIQYLHSTQGMQWREIYWRIWGRVQTLYCTQCQQYFSAADLGHCLYHPERPVFPTRSNVGAYPCCQQQVLRFDTSIYKTGCSARNHVIRVEQPNGNAGHSSIVDKLTRHSTLACVPFEERDKGSYLAPDARQLKHMQGGNAGENNRRAGAVDEEDEDDDESESERDRDNGKCNSGSGYWRSSGLEASCSQTSAYCIDPPPEHTELWRSRDPFPSKRGLATRSQKTKDEDRNTNSKKMPVTMPDGKKECKDVAFPRKLRSRSASKAGGSQGGSRNMESKAENPGFARSGTREDPSDTRKDSTAVSAGDDSGKTAQRGDLNPGGQKSFFELAFPTGVTGKKEREFRMDMLREDDRRRMDELSGRIRTQKARCATRAPNPEGLIGKRALAWVSEVSDAKTPEKQVGASPQKTVKAAMAPRRDSGLSKTR